MKPENLEQFKISSRENWAQAAEGWKNRAEFLSEMMMPVSVWLIDAIDPQPGQTILELAAGTGEVGLLAAEMVKPGGTLICSDFSPEMLTVAQQRAAERELDNVRFKQIDALSIDIPAGTVDAVICRWGYMLMSDPVTALKETRRVLRPGRPVSFAAWTRREDNPWASLGWQELENMGVSSPTGEPGPFSWAEQSIIENSLSEAGFVDFRIESIDIVTEYPSFENWWQSRLEMSPPLAAAFARLSERDQPKLLSRIEEQLEHYSSQTGRLAIPGKTWVAVAYA